MGISVAFLKPIIFDLSKKLELKDKLIISRDNQVTIHHFGDTGLPVPQTIISLKSLGDRFEVYDVTHWSNTIEEPIRLWDKYTDEYGKYQKKMIFEIIYDKKTREAYITAPKDTTNEFLQRANALSYLKLERYPFNLNIKKVPEILNIYGKWCRTDKGNIRCEAKFGFDVHTNSTDGETTTLNMQVRTESGECDITISREGQISSHTKSVTVNHVIEFYHLIKLDLLSPL
ncbi:MAG: hypothetical protein JW789_03000 [Candidatus Aenigmarchaeota archaeon]|nr:hypothetical protein [Candidatus Aenigmarchaeota archaeon]